MRVEQEELELVFGIIVEIIGPRGQEICVEKELVVEEGDEWMLWCWSKIRISFQVDWLRVVEV